MMMKKRINGIIMRFAKILFFVHAGIEKQSENIVEMLVLYT